MDAEPVAIPEDTSVERALDEYFLRYRWPWFPVVDAGERFRGLLVREAADDVPELSRASRTVGDVFELDATRDAAGARRRRRSSRCSATTPCAGSAGWWPSTPTAACAGVITADQVGRALRDALGRDASGRAARRRFPARRSDSDRIRVH